MEWKILTGEVDELICVVGYMQEEIWKFMGSLEGNYKSDLEDLLPRSLITGSQTGSNRGRGRDSSIIFTD